MDSIPPPPPPPPESRLPPCGACRFLHRTCVRDCEFTPYFSTDQEAAQFAGVHKVFGARNTSKLLLQVPVELRRDAVATITYEAEARISYPVYGCVGSILALQQKVTSLQARVAIAQSQLINRRRYMANIVQPPQHRQYIADHGTLATPRGRV